MDVNELTVGQARELIAMFSKGEPPSPSPWKVGTSYLVRTVTLYCLGRLSAIYPGELVFENASWVADTGRWNHALVTGELDEVEPHVGPCIVCRGAVVDAVEWAHDLPSKVK